MKRSYTDPIVAEVRRVRDEHARRFNYDIHAICEDIRKAEAACGHPLVRFRPRKLVKGPHSSARSEAHESGTKAAGHER